MRTILFALAVLLLAGSAVADTCDDLWFTRNLIMDRQGYCFGTRLGQTIFDNGNCTGKSVRLNRRDKRLVQRIQAQESELGCRVNTGGTELHVPDMDFRWDIADLPVATDAESGCSGWQKAPTPLFMARDITSPIVARILPGDDVSYRHWTEGDWQYVVIHEGGWGSIKGAGWLIEPTDEASCRQWAG